MHIPGPRVTRCAAVGYAEYAWQKISREYAFGGSADPASPSPAMGSLTGQPASPAAEGGRGSAKNCGSTWAGGRHRAFMHNLHKMHNGIWVIMIASREMEITYSDGSVREKKLGYACMMAARQ